MLSNLVVTNQSFVLIIDEIDHEKIAHKFVCQLLREQGQDELTIKTLPLNSTLKEEGTLDDFINTCAIKCDIKWNILLPPLSDLLCYVRVSDIFNMVHTLRRYNSVERIFLWLSTKHLFHTRSEYLIAAFRHMADLVLHLRNDTELTITTRKSGGGVTERHYSYTRKDNQFLVEPINNLEKMPEKTSSPKTDSISATFKIELEEDELTARNALKLPYEKTSTTSEAASSTAIADNEEEDEEDDIDDDLCV